MSVGVYTCYSSICRKWYKHHHSQLDKEVSISFSHCFLGKVGRKEGAAWDHWNEPHPKAMDLDEIIGDPVRQLVSSFDPFFISHIFYFNRK